MYARGVSSLILTLLMGFMLVGCSMGTQTGTQANATVTLPPTPSDIPSSSTPQITIPPVPSPTAVIEITPEVSHPVLVISWDGAPAIKIYHLMSEGELGTFASLAEQGIRAE